MGQLPSTEQTDHHISPTTLNTSDLYLLKPTQRLLPSHLRITSISVHTHYPPLTHGTSLEPYPTSTACAPVSAVNTSIVTTRRLHHVVNVPGLLITVVSIQQQRADYCTLPHVVIAGPLCLTRYIRSRYSTGSKTRRQPSKKVCRSRSAT